MIKDRQGQVVRELEGQNQLLKKLYSTSIGRCALKILVSPFITHLGGFYMSSPLSKTSISSFIKNNSIDMRQYEEKKYKSYNDFFTRRIKEGERPFDKSDSILMAPADSKLTYYPINEETILEIKDTKYQLKDLLQDQQLANEYDGGVCLVFRLAVDDYHRYSYVDDGQIVGHKKIKGIFHTVNPIANDYYPIYKMNSREYTVIDSKNFGKMIQMEVGGRRSHERIINGVFHTVQPIAFEHCPVYKENTRKYCIIKTKEFGTILMMEVGAMMVGRITNHEAVPGYVTRGEEKGYFEFGGSTVVLIFKKDTVKVDDDIINNSRENVETRVLLGQKIGCKGV